MEVTRVWNEEGKKDVTTASCIAIGSSLSAYNPNKVFFKKLDPEATIPVRGTPQSAGWDLFALADTTIIGGQGSVIVPTGNAIMIPEGCYGRIAMRSGLAVKQHLSVSAGTIDKDYFPGPIGVVTFCTKIGHEYTIKKGERFAQIVIEKCHYGECGIINESVNESSHKGFGSTGVF